MAISSSATAEFTWRTVPHGRGSCSAWSQTASMPCGARGPRRVSRADLWSGAIRCRARCTTRSPSGQRRRLTRAGALNAPGTESWASGTDGVDDSGVLRVETDERRQRILSKARRDGRVEVGSLALELEVAAETVRRDLRILVDRGVLQRVHGGAVPVESAGFENSLAHRVASHASERRRIAVAAAQRLTTSTATRTSRACPAR